VFKAISGQVWKGILPKADGAHEYDVVYRTEPDKLRPGMAINQIVHVSAVRRLPMTRALLVGLSVTTGKRSRQHAASLAGGDGPAPLTVGEAIRRYGDTPWYRGVEARSGYIAEWYADALCPPYERAALAVLSQDAVVRLARLAVESTWKLCFWWMNGAENPLLEELDEKGCADLAQRLGSAAPTEQQRRLIAAYNGEPFGKARRRGDSWVELWRAHTDVGAQTVDECVEAGIARVIHNSDPGTPDRLVSVGDAMCEDAVVAAMVAATTTGDDSDCRMTPAARRWPRPERGDPEPTQEQWRAIDSAAERRLFVVSGKPGTGKTSIVMKAVYSMFKRGTALVVSFTGMAAQNTRRVLRAGVTAHKVVDAWRRAGGGETKFTGRSVLIVEEASTVSMLLMHALLQALGPSLRRIYIFGDHRQMPPPGGGASLIGALIRRYGGTALVADLTTSMRLDDPTGILGRDLDAICDRRLRPHHPRDGVRDGDDANDTDSADDERGFSWTTDPTSDHPFVFVQRGETVAADVAIVRKALAACGVKETDDVDADDENGAAPPTWQIMVADNATRRAFARSWFETGPLWTPGMNLDDHGFVVGERVMFTKNANATWKPPGSRCRSAVVMNGTVGQIVDIVDEDPTRTERLVSEDGSSSQLVTALVQQRPRTTADQKQRPQHRRWIRVRDVRSGGASPPATYAVCLDHYGSDNVERIPPATVDKMQGQEADICVLLLRSASSRLGTRGIYTACSRARRKCIVVADVAPSAAFPSADFEASVMAGDRDASLSLDEKLPDAEQLIDDTAGTCVPGGNDDDDDDDNTDEDGDDDASLDPEDDEEGVRASGPLQRKRSSPGTAPVAPPPTKNQRRL
jgi:hypothetical protein